MFGRVVKYIANKVGDVFQGTKNVFRPRQAPLVADRLRHWGMYM